MDDDKDNMLLNLTTGDGEDFKFVSESERKHTKQLHHQSKERRHTNRKNFSKSSSKDDGHKKVMVNETPEKFQIISSLFRKNPEIPLISSDVLECDVRQDIEDQTFSGSEFKHLNLAPFMISNLESNLHMTKMTSVQKASLPLLIDGKDMFIKSPTGTGKTLTYVIPVIQSLQAITPKIQRADGPYCVVLVPTRELALQSLTVVQQVLKPFIWIVPGCVTGGEKRKSEKARLRKGMNILVATPGRLVDHLKTTKCLKMTKLQWLILDEADRLLDMGFEKDLSFILSTIKTQANQKIQTVLLSATLSKGVERLIDITLNEPVSINMTEHEESATAADNSDDEYAIPNGLKQFCVVVPMKLRLVTLAAFLKQNYEKNCKVIVFFTTQDSVDFHWQLFSSTLSIQEGKMNLMKLHGNMTQKERTKVYLDFKKSKVGVLLCTDVASRGLDLPCVNWIVQYNPPVSAADYVHRVGRTARIGSSGQALLFLLPNEVGFLDILSQHKLRLKEMKMDDVLSFLSTNNSFKSSQVSNQEQLYAAVTSQHMLFEEALLDPSNKGLKKLAQTAFSSFIGAYNTFPSSMKQIFHPKNLHLGHLAKSFAFRETPTELKEEQPKRKSLSGNSKRTKKDLKRYREVVSESGSNQILKGPLTKKSKRARRK